MEKIIPICLEVEFWYGLAIGISLLVGVLIPVMIVFYLIARYTKYFDFFPWATKEKHYPESARRQEYIKREASGLVLDLETGHGLTAITAARKPEVTRVVAVDMDPRALAEAMENAYSAGVWDKIEFRQGDLFDAVGDERFDYIVLNPPYLSSRAFGLIRRFLKEAKDHLRPGGRILLTISTLDTRTHEITQEEIERDYEVKVLETWMYSSERRLYLSLKERSHQA